ncbi:MAG: glycoside hydrolase family 3 C-terminal domain-containing protein [Clostridiales bacterium]|nr:glycoside hydrolase family 3 C-terminal domain-containing protein [Clostridiales bacterium]
MKGKALKRGRVRAWAIVTALLLVLLIVVNIVLTTYVSAFMDSYFGGTRQTKGSGNEYYSLDEGITDKESALAYANALVEEIAEEGTVLLKNEDNVLPLSTSESNKLKVTVFGNNSINLVYVRSGSVGGDTDEAPTVYDALESANFECNPVMKEAYENSGTTRPDSPSMGLSGSVPTGFATGEADSSIYTEEVLASFEEYNDAAIVVISRTSGESYDLPMSMIDTEGAFSEEDHYLELDRNEQEMLQIACENFDTVILVINSGTSMELGFLDEEEDNDETVLDYDFASHIQAVLLIGLPGEQGINALGKILNGEVNPSGRTVDTYARDFTTIPATINFSCIGESGVDSYTVDGSTQSEYFIDYEEGIYVGYRYFETRGETDGEEWYTENVVYPFGYGLSYTTFTQEIIETNIEETSSWSADTEDISITVRVTNTGDVAGKEVVQIYYTAPYTDGEIEKSSKVLVGYAKTDTLEPGAYEDVTVTFDAYDLASYDYNDANGNDFCGYEVEAGEYIFTAGVNSHDAYDTVTTTLTNDIQISEDTTTGYTVENRFEDADDQLNETQLLSRSDWEGTMPQARTAEEKEVSSDFISVTLKDTDSGNPLTEDSDVVVENASSRAASTVKAEGKIQLYELIGLDADDEKWDTFLTQFTVNQLYALIETDAFGSPADEYAGKPQTIDLDGPSGFTNSTVRNTDDVYDTCFYCSESLLGATWNTDLAYKMGVALGNEALVGDESTGNTYNGIYAPGVNIHRTPFGGRNPEYYSEDSVLSGYMAASLIEGASSKGVYCFMKHFAVNDQETHRNGVCTWLTEQTLREVYLKTFEIAVKEGGATAVMTSFNRIGTTWAGGSYNLITEVLHNEWGFEGAVITDFATGQSQMDIKQMVYAGGDMWLDVVSPTKWFSTASNLDLYQLQESAKHILYTVANSNAMNGIGAGSSASFQMAYWRMVMYSVDVILPVTLIIWGMFVFGVPGKIKRRRVKKTS